MSRYKILYITHDNKTVEKKSQPTHNCPKQINSHNQKNSGDIITKMKQQIKKAIIYMTAIVIPITASSCATWSTKDWQKLEDRTFVFQKFNYYNKLENKDRAFTFMKKFQIRKVLDKLEDKYSIRINTEAYDEFIKAGKSERIEAHGILFDNEFTWEEKEKAKNRIEFEYAKFEDPNDPRGINIERTYKLLIIADGKIRKRYEGRVLRLSQVIEKLSERISEEEGVTGVASPTEVSEARRKRKVKSKKKVEGLLEKLSPEERELLKKKLGEK